MVQAKNEAILGLDIDVLALVPKEVGVVPAQEISISDVPSERESRGYALGPRTEPLATNPLLPLLLDLSPRRLLMERVHLLPEMSNDRHDDEDVEAHEGDQETSNLEPIEDAATEEALRRVDGDRMVVQEVAVRGIVAERLRLVLFVEGFAGSAGEAGSVAEERVAEEDALVAVVLGVEARVSNVLLVGRVRSDGSVRPHAAKGVDASTKVLQQRANIESAPSSLSSP